MWARTGILLLFQVKQSSPRILIHMWTNQLSLSHGENQIFILFTSKFSLLGICCVEPFFTFWNFYYTCHTNDTYHISLSPSFNVIHVKFSAAFWELFSRKKIASSWQHNFTYKIRCLFQWPAVVAYRLCWEKFGWHIQKSDELLLLVLKEYNKYEVVFLSHVHAQTQLLIHVHAWDSNKLTCPCYHNSTCAYASTHSSLPTCISYIA